MNNSFSSCSNKLYVYQIKGVVVVVMGGGLGLLMV